MLSTPSTVILVTAKKQNSCSARTRAKKEGRRKKEEREVNKVVLQVSQQKTSLRDWKQSRRDSAKYVLEGNAPQDDTNWGLNQNLSSDRYSAIRYREDNFLASSICLLASCFLLGFILRFLAVAHYAFELTNNHLLNKPMKSVQNLMTVLG